MNTIARSGRGSTQALALLGGLLIVAVAALVTTSVLLRSITSRGIDGDFELVQVALAIAVFAFLPLCQARRANVVVDTFTAKAPPAVRRGLDVLWDLTFAGFAGFIAWRLALGAAEAFTSRTTSMVLGLPTYGGIAACAAMAGVLALTCLATAFARLKNPE